MESGGGGEEELSGRGLDREDILKTVTFFKHGAAKVRIDETGKKVVVSRNPDLHLEEQYEDDAVMEHLIKPFRRRNFLSR